MKTHEGADAQILSVENQLRRSVLSCLLWENTFYESGQKIEDRIKSLASECDSAFIAQVAIEARNQYKLRSVPLLLSNILAKKGGPLVSKVIENIIQRPDEITRFMSMYWNNGKTPISKQVKKGLSAAFNKFNEYQFAKWDRKGDINLRDVMFMVHPKPTTEIQRNIFDKIANKKLSVPDTWEVGLSAAKTSEEKKAIWVRLIKEDKLGALALLKNFRNIISVGVERELIIKAIRNINVDKVLPYRFVTAEKYAKEYTEYLEGLMYRCLANREKIEGKTVLLVDVSGSMDEILGKKQYNFNKVSEVNETRRLDVAIGLAILLKFLCKDVVIYTFSDDVVKIDNASGFRLGEKIKKSQQHNCTYLGKAIKNIHKMEKEYDRMIVITDEQSHDNIETSISGKGYIMNIAPYEHGINFDAQWVRINGFSEAVIDWMIEYERPFVEWTKKLDDIFDRDWSK